MYCANGMLLALTIVAMGMITGTATKKCECVLKIDENCCFEASWDTCCDVGEKDHSLVKYGSCSHVTNCYRCMRCLGSSCQYKYCNIDCVNGDCETVCLCKDRIWSEEFEHSKSASHYTKESIETQWLSFDSFYIWTFFIFQIFLLKLN